MRTIRIWSGAGPKGSADRARRISRFVKANAMTARALWCTDVNEAAILAADIGTGVLVRAQYSSISRGTERLVFQGRVPVSEHANMRAPFQEGSFTFPVKYGYAMVGTVMEGAMEGQAVFALFPHQTEFRLPEASLIAIPKDVPPARAVLAANMETALNILWDSRAGAGDRIAVIGAGVVGALVAYLALVCRGRRSCSWIQSPRDGIWHRPSAVGLPSQMPHPRAVMW